MKKVAYTVCSANHLAYAKTMADSLIACNNEYEVFICLVDRLDSKIDVSFFQPHKIMEVENIAIPAFQQMSNQYTLLELNCAVKPFMAQYIFNSVADVDLLLYFDSDIFIYNSLQMIENSLLTNDIIITPHYTTPIEDNFELKERELLRSGLYNAGFVGMKKSKTTFDFLQWWSKRLEDQCYLNFELGLGADQKWLDVVPLFFNNVYVTNNIGLNVAYWNLHERKLSRKGNVVIINETEPLIFLHVSGYKFETPEVLSKHQTRFNLRELPLLNELLDEYRKKVYANKYEQFINLPCWFAKPVKKSTGLMAVANKIIKPLGIKISGI